MRTVERKFYKNHLTVSSYFKNGKIYAKGYDYWNEKGVKFKIIPIKERQFVNMTALERMKTKSEEFTRLKMEAQKKGIDTIRFENCNGQMITFYYHSRRWNDRPSTVGRYKKQSR